MGLSSDRRPEANPNIRPKRAPQDNRQGNIIANTFLFLLIPFLLIHVFPILDIVLVVMQANQLWRPKVGYTNMHLLHAHLYLRQPFAPSCFSLTSEVSFTVSAWIDAWSWISFVARARTVQPMLALVRAGWLESIAFSHCCGRPSSRQ